MTMLSNLLIGLTNLFLVGCVFDQVDRLPEGTKFHEIRTTADMAGVFRNQGFSLEGHWHPLLSDVLLPDRKFDEPPRAIRLSSKMPSVVSCEAILNGRVIAVNDLVEGRDFHLTEGGMRLDRKFIRPGIDVTGVGIAGGSSVLRRADTGNVVLSKRGGAAGLMLFILPIGAIESQDAIFEKLE